MRSLSCIIIHTWWIYSLHEKMERQWLAPLHPMSCPLVPYLYGTSHMACCYDFVLKLDYRDLEIIKKILKKIWEKRKENLNGKIWKKGGKIFDKCCLSALGFGFSMCWSQKSNPRFWDIWRVSSWHDSSGKLRSYWALMRSFLEFEADNLLEKKRLRQHTG